jgi:hypothetical protein
MMMELAYVFQTMTNLRPKTAQMVMSMTLRQEPACQLRSLRLKRLFVALGFTKMNWDFAFPMMMNLLQKNALKGMFTIWWLVPACPFQKMMSVPLAFTKMRLDFALRMMTSLHPKSALKATSAI